MTRRIQTVFLYCFFTVIPVIASLQTEAASRHPCAGAGSAGPWRHDDPPAGRRHLPGGLRARHERGMDVKPASRYVHATVDVEKYIYQHSRNKYSCTLYGMKLVDMLKTPSKCFLQFLWGGGG
jgi:hypothetical protein